jgi:DNA-directed RNA polymerase specialized sigma24 family protein
MPSVRQRQGPTTPSKDTTVSDAELLARCRAGEVEAFEMLYRQHAGRIFALASRLAGSIDQGEDLLQ